MFNYVPIKHKQMSFVSNGAKFKLYTKRFNFSNAYSAQDFIQELRKIETRIIKLRLQLKDSEQELYQLYKCLEKIDHLSVALDSLLLINC
jgi:hypothetical protein